MSHIIYDIYFVNRDSITYDIKEGEQLIYDLTNFNNHRLFNKPTLYKFPCPKHYKNSNNNDCNYNGYTGFGVLMESHISIHTYPEKNKISIDIYSCKILDFKKNLYYIQNYFIHNKNKIFYKFIIRN
jgi:S-adenosylmethionine/arginine decarboxylase-like enzyme